MSRILVVEDDEVLRNELIELLRNEGYEAEYISTFSDTAGQIIKSKPDLVLLDINIPELNGELVLRKLRKEADIPVIMVTSRTSESDEVLSMSYGADDYITKPYNPTILMLRISAVIKRTRKQDSSEADTGEKGIYQYRQAAVNTAKGTLSRGEKELVLTKNEMIIFLSLLNNIGKIVSRDELMTALWDNEEYINDNALTVNISRLRAKLSDFGYEETGVLSCMKLKEYIKDELFKIILIIVYIILICGLLCAFNFGVQMAALMAVLAAIFFIIMFIWDFCRKRNFYNSLIDNTQRIDKKYLVIETLDEPEFYEGNLVYTAMYDINKSMIEHINQYERGQQDFKDFIEMWVHEIKLPIASLTLMCHNDKEHIDKKFITQLNRLDDYADKVLYYVRSENAEKDYSFGKVNLKTIINKTAVKNKDIILSNNISLNVHDIDTYVNTDAKWLEFIVNQIISNSIKYKKTSGEAYIEVYSEQRQDSGTDKVGQAVLHIKDNGIGIPAKDIDKVFIKSYTGSNGRNNAKSTGMGLYIAKNMCGKLGHNIEIKSIEGEYTEVEIIFYGDSYYNPVNIEKTDITQS